MKSYVKQKDIYSLKRLTYSQNQGKQSFSFNVY
jgi:hypothetical protein